MIDSLDSRRWTEVLPNIEHWMIKLVGPEGTKGLTSTQPGAPQQGQVPLSRSCGDRPRKLLTSSSPATGTDRPTNPTSDRRSTRTGYAKGRNAGYQYKRGAWKTGVISTPPHRTDAISAVLYSPGSRAWPGPIKKENHHLLSLSGGHRPVGRGVVVIDVRPGSKARGLLPTRTTSPQEA